MTAMHTHRKTAGFTMLEVLISMVIIAFGLLGVAGLQAFALKNSSSASQRLTATALANDMMDRLRSNFASVDAGGYNKPLIADYDAPSGCVNPSSSTVCTTAEVAQNDRYEWQQRVARALPNGRGIVCRDSTPNDGTTPAAHGCDDLGVVLFAVKIWWTDDRTSRDPSVGQQVFTTSFNP